MIFNQKVSIVTGASQGIGEAIAHELGLAGSTVVLVDIQKEKLEEVAGRFAAEGIKSLPLVADVTNGQQVEEAVESVKKDLGRIDHLINNAGITRDSLLLRMKEEDWDLVLAVNLKGAFNFCRSVVKHMVAARSGRIVSISSVVGLMGNFGQANYAASKAGLIGFSKSLAREVAARGITVNCVAPGYIATAMTEKLSDEVKKAFLDNIPMKRFGLPEEIAKTVKFLCSDEAAYITGQVISVNGGLYM
ncbi:MAG TPA: 3-oxoacyl-[acyl-carrier-protein] reductase [Candidatus Saccharicenans sp.]|jgi:3-oxoacyl-[acyl-carrier protein] reductase|nr:3-oxoacyl-[acyl-carrier-protein] reductase [Candidatus Saccharicenans sp.]HNT02052.1 3-oxoacyl-[acyl-carrier-protein] reductase [Candidatus Saccharicenans sp.]HPB59108.1 3-oxoacyl-[acyl-carrier-protein] reductase [Candidatus Saccharicenans sp.]HQO75228.1 3-oxoacyl-[acyl-carrier-protein] reductase [Candidatus Saccharicenans sp.]HUM78418.1 3-oxoacyl-[acyl-carrier-protein] reductase [Candidatus Saccharicenans sp.]